ncbi:hypothetical protein ATANTOWER_021204 [Ataeniobius toweri]|uniref:Uncharacterized protein n=1 Tax=Ataeniobius toweri TaxID=208326 RepID=A0ABU7AHW9_9TELE|nr:hypothetical protein [Ataeniobius toweri]
MELKLSAMLLRDDGIQQHQEEEDEEVRQKQASPVEELLKNEDTDPSQDEEEDEDDDGELALWCPDVNVVELQKERDKGLGFSILDYQVSLRLLHLLQQIISRQNIFSFTKQSIRK